MPALTRPLAFAGGLVTCAAVLSPPLSGVAERLFSFHMMQHLLLIAVAAPLLACAGTGRLTRLRFLRELTRPATAWTVFVAVFLYWHCSFAMRWAAAHEGSRWLEFVTILTGAWLFWRMALQPDSAQTASAGARALAVITAAIATDLPGVIMIFSPQAYCAMPHEDAGHWGLTVLEDQQIGGLMMWVPANLIFFGIAIRLLARWLSEDTPDPAGTLAQRPSAAKGGAPHSPVCIALIVGSLATHVHADDLDLLSHDDKQWVMAAKNYSSTRFSGLKQIDSTNASRLQVAWSFSVGTNHGQEAAPLVIGDTLYVVGAYPNELFALDSVSGDLKWKYTPSVAPAAQGVACCDSVNRGAAYDSGKIFFNTLDNHTVALDAKTGHEIWVAKLGEITRGQTMTMAPLIVQGKVLVGNSGGEMGIRGWLTALDENTGKIVWRAYSVGPDADVLIGPRFHPYYPDAQGKDLGVTTWPPGHWQLGGGPVWGWISYDPKTNVIFYGTGNPGPWNSNQRPGDNLWTTTIFARDAATGEALWADVLNPHDLYDTDEVNENILVDLSIDGRMRPVIVHPGRDGFLFVIDRNTGQIYSADKFGEVNRVDHFDLKTGRPVRNDELRPDLGKNVSGICPSSSGVKDWQPSAYSPDTHLVYIPAEHLCMSFKTNEVGYIAGTPYVGATLDIYAGAGGYRGEFSAWDLAKRQKAWTIREKFPVWTGVLATAGNLAVYGTLDRWFKVVNATDGSLVYQFHAPSGFVGQPVTYEGRDGNQYIAMLSGVGGWVAAIANAAIDPHVRNGALGMAGALGDLPAYTSGGSTLLVFALPHATGPAHAPAP